MDAMESVKERLSGYSYEEQIGGFVKSLGKAISDMDTDICAELIGNIRMLV